MGTCGCVNSGPWGLTGCVNSGPWGRVGGKLGAALATHMGFFGRVGAIADPLHTYLHASDMRGAWLHMPNSFTHAHHTHTHTRPHTHAHTHSGDAGTSFIVHAQRPLLRRTGIQFLHPQSGRSVMAVTSTLPPDPAGAAVPFQE